MTHSIKEKLEELAAARGCRDPLSTNIWNEDPAGEVRSEPGLFVPISYRRADNGRRLQGQIGGDNVRRRKKTDDAPLLF